MASLSPLSWLEFSLLFTLGGAVWATLSKSLADARLRAWISSLLAFGFAVAAGLDFSYFGHFASGKGFRLFAFIFGPGVFAIDLLNAPLIPLIALLCLVIIAVTLKTRVRRFSFARTLMLEACLLFTFSAHDPWLLIVMLGVLALPQAHELYIRGRSGRVYAIHMIASMLLIAGGWLLLSTSLAQSEPWLLTGYGLVAVGIAIRAGFVPAHCWVIDIFENAAFGTALVTMAPLVAVYATARLLIPGAPPQILLFMAYAALGTALYTAAMSTIQSDARYFVCYFFLSLASLALAGMVLPLPLGVTAGLFLWLCIPISVMGLGLTIRSLEARTGRLSLREFKGLYAQTPTLAAFFLITGLAAVGFPGTLGFFGLEMLTDAASQSSKAFGIVVIASSALCGIAVLRVYSITFLGTTHQSTADLHIRRVELLSFLSLVILLVGGTLWPQPGVNSRQNAAEMILQLRQEHLALRANWTANTRDKPAQSTSLQGKGHPNPLH